jgi:hypothetical protein
MKVFLHKNQRINPLWQDYLSSSDGVRLEVYINGYGYLFKDLTPSRRNSTIVLATICYKEIDENNVEITVCDQHSFTDGQGNKVPMFSEQKLYNWYKTMRPNFSTVISTDGVGVEHTHTHEEKKNSQNIIRTMIDRIQK